MNQLILGLAILATANGLLSPCQYKNITIISGVSHKPVVTPFVCNPTVNQSEFSVKPNIVYDKPYSIFDKFTVMLLQEQPNVQDAYSLNWLISNVTPLQKSLTANLTRMEFMTYTPPTAVQGRPTKHYLLVYKQNSTKLEGISMNDAHHFFPQKWVASNRKAIESPVGGAEFTVSLIRNQNHALNPSYARVNNTYGWNNRTNGSYHPGPGYQNTTYVHHHHYYDYNKPKRNTAEKVLTSIPIIIVAALSLLRI